MFNSHLSQILSNHFSLISHWLISRTYWALDFGLYDGHSGVLHGSIGIISTMFKSESNRIQASGIRVFFIRNECIQLFSNMKSIPILSDNDSLYISHNWRDSSSAAISRLKQVVLLQQIFGFSDSHASYLNTRKDMIKSKMNIVIQIVIFIVFFMFDFMV